jgi:hypothetical protein
MDHARDTHAQAEPLSAEMLDAIAAAEDPRTVAWCIESGGRRFWIKRTRGRNAWGSRLKSLLFIVVGLVLGRGLRRSHGFTVGADGLEAARLRFYRSKGLPVPAVVASRRGLIALEDVGESLRDWLDARAEEPARQHLVERAATELIRFHGGDDWHGGAQLRNLTLHDARIWRIDFEEPYGGVLATPLLQVYDLCLMLTSAERYVDGRTLSGLAQRWLRALAEPEIETAFRRVLGLIWTLSRLPLARLAGREYRRLCAARDAMHLAWERLRSEGLIEARPVVPLSWKAVALSISLVLVSDNLLEFVIEHDDPEEIFEFEEFFDEAV